jgi:hypothetical protein
MNLYIDPSLESNQHLDSTYISMLSREEVNYYRLFLLEGILKFPK